MVCVPFRVMAARVLTRHYFKVVTLLVSAWIVMTLFTSINIKNQLNLPHLSMYYNISLNKDLHTILSQTNDVQIYTRLDMQKVDGDDDSKTAIVYDAKRGIGSYIYIYILSRFLIKK